MNEIVDGDRTSDPAHRRDRGIEAYARIFDVPEKDMPAAMARRVGQVFAEEVFLAAGGPAWFHPALADRERSMLIIAALAAQGVAGERLDRHVRLAQRNGICLDTYRFDSLDPFFRISARSRLRIAL